MSIILGECYVQPVRAILKRQQINNNSVLTGPGQVPNIAEMMAYPLHRRKSHSSREWLLESYIPHRIAPRRIDHFKVDQLGCLFLQNANISYALLSAALIVLSMVHLILLTIHCLRPRQDPKPHYLLEISIFVLFICVNVVVIGIGLSGLTHGGEQPLLLRW